MRRKGLTLNEAWTNYREVVLSQKSEVIESSRWEKHIGPIIGKKYIDQVTSFDCLKLRKNLENKKLSPQSVHHCLSLIRRVMRRSIEWGHSDCTVPNFGIILPKFDNNRERFLTGDEANKLLAYLQETNSSWHDIVLFALNTGLRKGEIFSICESHIDFNNNFLSVVDTKSYKNRIIPLNRIATNILRNKVETCIDIFENKSHKIFTRAVEACGFNRNVYDRRQKVVFHTLRHTFASWLVQEGVPLSVISRLLGHSSIHLTMRYSHLSFSQEKNATDILGGLFGEIK